MAPRNRRRWAVASALLVSLLAAIPSGEARAGGLAPTLPLADDGRFLSNLSVPGISPGAATTLSFTLSDPLSSPLTDVNLTFALYAINGYPGNATGPLPTGSNAVLLEALGGSGSSVTLPIGTIGVGGSITSPSAVSVTVSAPPSASEGTYAIRSSLSFVGPNGSSYELRSRGYFSSALWDNATRGPNGTSTLNLSRLGVSGVLPETAVLVRSNPLSLPLYALLGAGVALAIVGAFYAARPGSRSSSGASDPPDDQRAPSALGKRRTSDGD
ncbi:MAG: hypothetical protein ACHQ2Y_06970 [Candidatus Lutacidiplasmatales archaeon]